MKSCPICNSQNLKQKTYNQHLEAYSLKSFLKAILPYLDAFVPESFSKIKRLSNKKKRLFSGFINLCLSCGHGIMDKLPEPSELEKYYEQTYRKGQIVDISGEEKNYLHDERAQAQIEFVFSSLGQVFGKDILEIGAGAAKASLLYRHKLPQSEVNLYVCEPGNQWEKYYQAHEIRKIANFFPFKTEKKFNYIHTSHWLEHAVDLDNTVSVLNQLLESNGTIFIEVPNTEHYYWDLPIQDTPHVQFFTRASLSRLFCANGFECIKIGEYGITFMEYVKGGKVISGKYGSRDKGFWIRGLFQKTN